MLGLKDVAVVEGAVCGDPLLGAEDLLVGDAIRLVHGAQFRDVSSEDIAGQRLRVMFDRVDIGSRLLEFTCAKSLMLISEFGVVAKARVLEIDSKGEDRTYLLFDEKIRPGAQHVILAEIGR
ncbi:hypothetical protein AB2B41_11650 [Marimonas sp. MJW-29]|uniref:Hint domain-containing protein n=1 Tax=Sulfitobacter sediminis TaxID=3234186 RepID=A0ABV3RMR3_9RHOB